MLRFSRVIGASLAAAMMLAVGPALAGANDYRFEPVGKPVKAGDTTLIRLRLVHLPDGKNVTGAIVIQPRLEMGAGHDAMTAPVKIVVAPEPGLYAVEAKPSMDGEWLLTIAAKVPGEAETIRGQLTLDLEQ